MIEGLKEMSATILNEGSGSFSYKRDDQTFLLNTRFLPEIGWYLLVEQSLDDETNLLRKTLLINLALCFIISLIILMAVQRTVSYYQQRLELMATTDKVTGLNNRHAGETLFSQAIRETFREPGKLSIILFDIDHFKKINDEHGHPAGDAVLANITTTVKSCLREADSIIRWGGEEFLVILKDCEIEDAFQIAEKIRLSVAAKAVVFQNASIPVNISLGVAQWQTDESGETLLMRADNAMYKAKSKGRNRTENSGN